MVHNSYVPNCPTCEFYRAAENMRYYQKMVALSATHEAMNYFLGKISEENRQMNSWKSKMVKDNSRLSQTTSNYGGTIESNISWRSRTRSKSDFIVSPLSRF